MRRTIRLAALGSAARRHSTGPKAAPDPSRTSKWASCVDEAGAAAAQPYRTHQVLNQSQPLEDFNAFSCDPTVRAALEEHDALWAESHVADFGACVGSVTFMEHARLANAHKPLLHTHNQHGQHVDVVEYHPSYHELQRLLIESGVTSFAWGEYAGREGAMVARASLFYLAYQLESGVCCPTTMTFAATPALMAASAPAVSETWLPLLASRTYDPRPMPAHRKSGVLVGMSMTEKQGGSDVRANTTTATPVHAGCADAGDQFTLIGHKWFTSAPMSDAFLTLAQAHDGSGVSCYLVPRILPDGTRNAGLRFLRLKDKIGDRSNASGEVEYSNAWGVQIGQSGKGVRTIVEMVVHTRLDCTIGSAALMRQSAQLAAHHCAQRHAFGTRLADAPLMRSVLLDLAAETEAANALWPRLAAAFDATRRDDPAEAAFRRIATAVGKYSVCKRAPGVVCEAMECLGGNGYVEDSGIMARLYRQAPLNAIWEGSGNVIALDVLRAVRKDRNASAAFLAELNRSRGGDSRMDALAEELHSTLDAAAAAAGGGEEGQRQLEARARTLVDRMGVALQAATLIQHGHPAAAEAFCASRLPGRTISTPSGGCSYGALGADFGDAAAEAALLDRLMPCTDLQKS